MHEQPSSPENQDEDLDRYTAWMADHPEKEVTPLSPEECGEKITEVEGLLEAFEQTHDLEALHAITELSPQDAPNHPIREPAHLDCAPILSRINILIKEPNTPPEKLSELKARYTILARAVGSIKNNIVEHSRTIWRD